MIHQPRRPAGARGRAPAGAVAVLLAVLAGCGGKDGPGPPAPVPTSTAAAPSRSACEAPQKPPSRAPILVTHFNTGSAPYVFGERCDDLAKMRKAFNAVIVKAGDQQLVEDARAAGLSVYVEMDRKSDFARGKDISGDVQEIVRQVKEHPGTIAGIRVADRLNGGGLDPDEAVGYLEATGGVFHREIPGVPVFADVVNWELTCGKKGQRNCVVLRFTRYRFEINKVLTRLYRSGHLDGFMLALELQGEDPAVVGAAFRQARALWPRPFQLLARTAPSFDEATFPGNAAAARRRTDTVARAPLQAGADGVDLWAWHRPYRGAIRTFLDKDGSTNPFWDQLVSVAVKAGVSA
ncbi:MAG TPA: hypothetical protein VNK73_18565 [Actinomycetota bacterium]|jgi:hypothetical protein|nr:hypothetical protein [Actinomycetota bacterium]